MTSTRSGLFLGSCTWGADMRGRNIVLEKLRDGVLWHIWHETCRNGLSLCLLVLETIP